MYWYNRRVSDEMTKTHQANVRTVVRGGIVNKARYGSRIVPPFISRCRALAATLPMPKKAEDIKTDFQSVLVCVADGAADAPLCSFPSVSARKTLRQCAKVRFYNRM